MPTRIVIAGAAGRMGRRLIALAAEDPALRVVGALESPGHAALGSDTGELAGVGRVGLNVTADLHDDFDVLIDFSSSAAIEQWLQVCTGRGRPIVIGTTGHSAEQLASIDRACGRIAVLQAANMSVGVQVMLRLVAQAAALLDAAYDAEITEAHHRFKVDAPSGTALALLDAVRRGRGGDAPVVHGRAGQTGARPEGQVGMHSLRIGDTVCSPTVQFGNLGETLTIAHSAHSRDTFAAGALRAAKWIIGKPPGKYRIDQTL